jgi:hypothetical protein
MPMCHPGNNIGWMHTSLAWVVRCGWWNVLSCQPGMARDLSHLRQPGTVRDLSHLRQPGTGCNLSALGWPPRPTQGHRPPGSPTLKGLNHSALAKFAPLISSPNNGVPPMRHCVKMNLKGHGWIQPRWGWRCFWTWLPMVGLRGQPWAE